MSETYGWRLAGAMLAMLALTSCESHAPLDFVELFPGTAHPYQLRIPYRVTGNANVHRPLRSYDYTISDWLPLDGDVPELSAANSHRLRCPEGTVTSASSYPIRGRVAIAGTQAIVDLEIQRNGWNPYEFNGVYRLQRGDRPPIDVANGEKANCRPASP